MRVLLIYPTARFEVFGNNPAALEASRGANPPLGLLSVAAYLEEHSAHDVAVVDAHAEDLSFDALAARIRAAAPDVVGVTALTPTLVDVVRTVATARSAAPHAPVVLGGPHVHLFSEESLALPGVDYAVLGEGERVFLQLLERLGDTGALARVRGLVFRCDGRVVNTGPPPLIDDLDALPFPARHLTDVWRYDSVLAPRRPVTTTFTSRGCPYACTFCDRPHLGKRFRARSAKSVVDELERCGELGIRDFLVYDDTYTVRRQRVIDISQEILRRGLDVGYDVRARVDTVDPEMLAWMARSGCRGVHYGVEAGTERVLRVLRKGFDLAAARRAFAATRRAGMSTLAYFIVGNPTETREDIRATFRVARELDPDFLHLTVLTPFPGTEIYRQGLATGLIERDPWRDFAARPSPTFVPPHWPENFSDEELNELLVEGYRGFYRRPRYLFRRLAAARSPWELVRKGKAGLRLLTMRSKARR